MNEKKIIEELKAAGIEVAIVEYGWRFCTDVLVPI